MQLSHQKPIAQKQRPTGKNVALALAQASSLLLCSNISHAASMEADSNAALASNALQPSTESAWHQFFSPGWKVDTAVLKYDEDNRVSTIEPVIIASKDFGDERVLSGKLLFDTLSGASPSGQLVAPATSTTVQTCTSASGKTVTCGGVGSSTPAVVLVPFTDQRLSLNGSWTQPLAAEKKFNIGANISQESDFLSTGINIALSKDINNKNTTLSMGLSGEFDQISPESEGGTPTGLSLASGQQKAGNKTKTVADALVGITQIINRQSLMQFNYAYSQSSGYLSDPYKVLSTLSSSYALINNGMIYENRPDKRSRHSLFAQYKNKLDTGDIVDISYRFTVDDWDTQSHTLDTKYRFDFDNFYVEPHGRYYQQTKANFYKPYLLQGTDFSLVKNVFTPNATLVYASSDTRLAEFSAQTVGIKLGYIPKKDSEISLRFEQYQQTLKNQPVLTSGSLKNTALAPELKATLIQLSYGFKW